MTGPNRDNLDREEAIGRILRRPARGVHIPPFATVQARLTRRTPYSRIVLATTAAVVIALVVGALLADRRLRVAEPQATPPLTSASPAEGRGPHLLLAHRLVLDTVPGGGPVVTQAFDSFRVLSADGIAKNSVISGVAIGTPTFDGVSRVAYWARTSLASGDHRLTVWDATTQQERVILTLGDERPAGDPLWTADGRALIVSTQTSASDRIRVIRVDATGAASKVLSDARPESAIRPVYGDDSIIVGLRGQAYVVLDARTGQQVSEAPLRSPTATDFNGSRPGLVVELVRTFEGESGPLRIWRVADPGTTVATVDERGITTPLYWPGLSEVVYVRDKSIYAIDFVTGATRLLASLSDAPALVGFNAVGDRLIVRTGNAFSVFERVGNQLRARPDLGFVFDPSLLELVGVAP